MDALNLVDEIQVTTKNMKDVVVTRGHAIDRTIRINYRGHVIALTKDQTEIFLETCTVLYFIIADEVANMPIGLIDISRFVAIPYM